MKSLFRILQSIFLFPAFFFCCLSPLAADTFSTDFSADNLRGFILHLIDEGEYNRAVFETERLMSYYPDYLTGTAYSATINYLYYKQGSYNATEFKSGDMAEKISLFFSIDYYVSSNNFSNAESVIMRYNQLPEDVFLDNMVNKRELYLALMTVREYNFYGEESIDFREYADYILAEKKEPWKGFAAGIIPGMGYIYAGETGTGITAMIVIGLGSAVTVLSWKNGIEPLALISGSATSLFYGGSIIGGYRETVRHNRALHERLDLRVRRDLEFDKDAEKVFIKFGIRN